MENIRRRLTAACAALAGLSLTPTASAADFGVSAHAGTLGLGADLAYSVTRTLNVRGGINTLELSEDFTEEGVDYSNDLELESLHLLADWHVLDGGFRLTGGAVLNNNAFRGEGSVDAGDEVGDAIAVGSGDLSLDVTYDEVAPYVGIGWGNRARGRSPVSFAVDLGLMYQGTPDVDIDQSGSIGVSASDLEKEEREIEDELESFDLYPVLSASIVFRF